MPTQITQVSSRDGQSVRLRVTGELLLEDARLLKKIALEMSENQTVKPAIDLADLDLLDSDSAAIIKELEESYGFVIEGLEIFRQKIVSAAEKSDPKFQNL